MFMSRFIRTDYHAGQIFIPHRSCAAHDKPMQKCLMFYRRITRFWHIFVAENSAAAEDLAKCYSVSRSQIDENNDIVSKSWIVSVYRHGIVAKPTSAAVNTAAETLAFPNVSTHALNIKRSLSL